MAAASFCKRLLSFSSFSICWLSPFRLFFSSFNAFTSSTLYICSFSPSEGGSQRGQEVEEEEKDEDAAILTDVGQCVRGIGWKKRKFPALRINFLSQLSNILKFMRPATFVAQKNEIKLVYFFKCNRSFRS